MPLREILLLVVVCLVWGGHMLVIRVTVADTPPMFYVAIRLTLMILILSPFLRWRTGSMLRVAAAGSFLAGFNYALMFTGFKYATASAGAIAMELSPPFATILSVFFLHEKVGWRRIAGIALAFFGVALIALNPTEQGVGVGVGLIALAALSEAAGSVLVKSLKGFRPIELLACFSVVGAVINWSGTALFETGQIASLSEQPLAVGGAILYSIFLASIFGHTSYYWLLQRRPVSMIAPSLLLTTLFAVLLGVALLGEQLTPIMIAGGLMTIAGVGVILLRSSPKSPATVAAGPEPHPAPETAK